VSESPTAIAENRTTNSAARLGWALLIFATLYFCYFSHLGAIGFVGPDEPRYAWIARDMAETGDWVTPRLYGKPWFEKPPLFYWGAALSFKFLGVSEAAARLPSAISAFLATLALAWLAWRLYGAETARWLLLLLPTSVGMIGFSHAAATDMPFSGMLTIAMVCAAVILGLSRNENTPILPRTPWFALLLFGFFLGLAVLAKGPAAIILSGGAVFFWALFTKRWRDALRLFHPVALVSFCATALPWYILCALRNPDFFHIFIIEHNFKRFLTPEFQHIQPFWYYGPILLAALFPWSAIFLWSSIASYQSWKNRTLSHSTGFFLAWVVFCVAFFSISQSKLPGYILPALPPIALLVAHKTKTWFEQPKFTRWPIFLEAVVVIWVCPLAIYFDQLVPTTTDLRPSTLVMLFSMLTLVGGIAGAMLAFFRRLGASTIAIVVTFLTFLAVGGYALEESDPAVSARWSAETVLSHLTAEQAAGATTFKLRRAYKYQVDFYLHRETEEWSPAFPKHSIIFTDRGNFGELEALGARCGAYPRYPAAVRICESSKGDPILMHGSAGSGQPQ
jgi:4-amino-4-deoxy-L-arabinose transferase-like glycosyltransferase